MNKEQFINKEIVNANNEVGIVTSFDDTFVTVKYQKEQKSYRIDLAFKNKFLSFKDNSLNILIENEIKTKDEIKDKQEKQIEENRVNHAAKFKKVNEIYDELDRKNDVLKALFGSDFLYPPYVEFVNKNRNLIIARTLWDF